METEVIILKQVSQRQTGKCHLPSSVRHLDGEMNARTPSGRRAFCGGRRDLEGGRARNNRALWG